MRLAHLAALAVIAIGLIAWKKNKLNAWLPGGMKHHFVGLDRSGQYFTAPGGGPGVPGLDINTSLT
ncbi:MAG: hypothetical protein ACYC6M_16635 [Terriglobales bacterium]